MRQIDPTKPNAGRIYDYLLGGHHNFEADRKVGDWIAQTFPGVPTAMRLQRWCLQDVAQELVRRGFDVIIDFASGLPTQDHVHQVVPPEITVIYSDYDPLVVEYAQDILKDAPNAYCFQADARRPEDLLERPEVKEILGDKRDVGMIFWGVAGFIPDEDLKRALQYIYEWSGPNAVLAFNAQFAEMKFDPDNPAHQKGLDLYRAMGAEIHTRTLAQYLELIKPWQPEQDFVPLLEWHGFDASIFSEQDRALLGKGGGGYGAYLVKRAAA